MSEKAKVGWQSHVKNLREGILKVYKNKEFSDIGFIKGQQHFKAHKLVLAARSPVFAEMLLNTCVPDEIIIEEDSITATGFDILLRFIYTNKIGTDDRKAVIEAYVAANYYQQRALQLECEKTIDSWPITKDDVCKTLDVGLSIKTLKDKYLAYIKNNAQDVMSSPSFLEISFKGLCTVLESGVLKNVPALTRIHRIMAWAGKHYTITDKMDYSRVREDFLSNEPPLLSKLEFEALSLNDLAAILKAYKGLLTSTEVMQFMEYSADADASLLPDWCMKS